MTAGLYKLVLWLALPVVWLRLHWRARREPAYAQRVSERFGRVPPDIPQGCIWFHTVSAGETIAAAPLIRQLAEEFSATPFLVTTMTPTGSEQVSSRLADCAAHCYAPYDFGFAVARFYDRVQPRLLVLMETELWPNLIASARQRNIPVLLVNARLSERSAKGYARVAGLTRPMLSHLSAIACQTESHARRFVALGADRDTTQAMGSVKYDVREPPGFAAEVAALRSAFALQQQPVWIAASTHPGEDECVLEAFRSVRQSHPQVRLILVPRHPVRADEVCALVQQAGLGVARQSVCLQHAATEAPDVIVGDVMGSLLQLYGLADVAFVGGSFVPVGGHNPLEPALCGIPIISGPHQFNFTDVMADLEQRGGLRTISERGELAATVGHYLGDKDARQQAGAAAVAALQENRGATARVAELLRGWIRTVLLQ